MNVRTRVSIVGATGYSGAELCAILARHPRVELVGVHSSSGGGSSPFASLHPSLAGRSGPAVTPFVLASLLASRPEFVFLATPNEAAAEIAPKLLASGCRVIDLSGAFRLPHAEAYPKWYGFTHPAPELLKEAVYGLSEWADGALAGARLVANPGCYPTSVILPLRPLMPLLAEGHAIVCDSASGVSGAGKKSDLAFSFGELSGNFKAYGVGSHRHEPEMRNALGLNERAPFVFVAHLLPVVRGILSTIHVTFDRPVSAEELTRTYRRAYDGKPFVRLHPAGTLPDLKDVVGTPFADIGFSLLGEGRQAVVVCCIDNLLKGAASQAVQNLNRMIAAGETEGLS
jgi:N-acetyl-gamma-glutamyl-phosphate reductase